MFVRALGLFVLACGAGAGEPARIVEAEVLSHENDILRLSGEVAFEGAWPEPWQVFFQLRRFSGELVRDARGKDLLIEGKPSEAKRFLAEIPLGTLAQLRADDPLPLKVECHVWDRKTGTWAVNGFDPAPDLLLACDESGKVVYLGYANAWLADLGQADPVLRRAAIQYLRQSFLPARTAAKLAAALKDPEAEVRRGAILCLRGIGGRSIVVRPALQSVWRHEDGWMRYYASEWFVEEKNPPAGALDVLATVLSEPEYELRNLAAAALVEAGKASSAALQRALAAGGAGAVHAACALLEIGEAGRAAFPVLDAAIWDAFLAQKDLKTGLTLCGALERISPEALDAVPLLAERIEKFGADDAEWKMSALRAIAKFGPAGKPASRGIRALLGDKDGRVREVANAALSAVEGNKE